MMIFHKVSQEPSLFQICTFNHDVASKYSKYSLTLPADLSSHDDILCIYSEGYLLAFDIFPVSQFIMKHVCMSCLPL